jgi:hypothetical protein
MPGDPYSDPVTGVLYNELGLSTAAGLEAAEREITRGRGLRRDHARRPRTDGKMLDALVRVGT